MTANQTNWNTISMIAELTWKDNSFTALLRPEWRDRVAKRTETSEAQLQHHMRIDRLMILLQSFSEFAVSRAVFRFSNSLVESDLATPLFSKSESLFLRDLSPGNDIRAVDRGIAQGC